jgi:hypothetical protein
MKNFKLLFSVLITIIIFLSNLIPIIGTSLASNSIGFNEKRWKKRYKEIKRKMLIIPIIIGNFLFSALLALFLALFLSFSLEFTHQQYLWIIVGLLLVCNLTFSISFYFIGIASYKKIKNKPINSKE